MSKVIEAYYEQAQMMPLLVQQKLKKFDSNPDVAAEFEDWIVNKNYKKTGAVTVQGFTAEKLASMSEYMDGEAAFITLIDLREQPEKTVKKIKSGYKRK